MHLPMSSEDPLHFYRYLHTHILIANLLFLLLIDVPIQDHTQQLSIYKIFYSGYPSQHDVISAPHILGIHRMQLWQEKFHKTSSAYVKQQTDSFVTFIHHFNHLPTLCFASQPYMPRMQLVFPIDVCYKSEKLKASVYHHKSHLTCGY